MWACLLARYKVRSRYVSFRPLFVSRANVVMKMPNTQRIRIVYLGRMLRENEPLVDQGWKPGQVINAMVVARPSWHPTESGFKPQGSTPWPRSGARRLLHIDPSTPLLLHLFLYWSSDWLFAQYPNCSTLLIVPFVCWTTFLFTRSCTKYTFLFMHQHRRIASCLRRQYLCWLALISTDLLSLISYT